jgi:methionine-rich copper-binding protein CopC
MVQDGYVAGALIFLDRNANRQADAEENTGLRTDHTGSFSGTVAGSGVLLASGGTNIDTGLRNTLTLAAPQGAAVISPVTTLMQLLMGSEGLSSSQAAQQLGLAFGLAGVNVFAVDPLRPENGALGLTVQKVNAQLATTSTLTSSSDLALQNIARFVSTAVGLVNLADTAVLTQALGALTPSASILQAISQANAQIQASTSIADVSQVQKAAVLAALNPATDLLAPAITTFNPVLGTQGLATDVNLVFVFNEPVQRGSGVIELRTADGTLVQRFEANSPLITIDGNTVTINPSADLKPSTGYAVVFAPDALRDLAGNAFIGSAGPSDSDGSTGFTFSTAQAPGDEASPVAVRFGEAGSTRSVAMDANLTITFNELIQIGPGAIRLKTPDGQMVETFTPANATASGSTLTLNPSADLGLFTRYVLQLEPQAVRDLAGNGLDSTLSYNFRTASADGLYHMFVAAFAAAPGVTYMSQLAEAYNHFNDLQPKTGEGPSTLQQIVEIFTTKPQFTSVFPQSLSDHELAVRLVNRIVKTSATDAARTEAVRDIEAALGIGWSRGKLLYTVFGNLANKPLADPTWGNTAKQFQNQLAVARYFTEVLAVDTTDLARLQGVLSSISPDSDVSAVSKIVEIIGTVPPPGG